MIRRLAVMWAVPPAVAALLVVSALLMVTVHVCGLLAAEGMFPLSEMDKVGLAAAGLQIPPDVIYDPDGLSLIDGICKLDGCTGSFVSPDGLILTNHHCAFRAVQMASSAEHDYLTSGFLAPTRSGEFPAKGYTVRITESYRDVSAEVLSVITPDMDPTARTKSVEQRQKEIMVEAEAALPGKRAEVAEMFIGKTYILFIYTYLKDVRLVYAPPRAIGNFGGEKDNWMWPRHTGDFSFLRAYVGRDGAPAEYAADNEPYRPRRYLQVAPAGVEEGDFVFICGYPARTHRHRTSFFLEAEANIRMPWVVDWNGWQIATLERLSAEDPAAALRLAPRLRSLHNRVKNYRGKLQGIRRLDLVDRKRQEEAEMQAFIAEDPTRAEKYGNLLGEIQEFYAEQKPRSAYELWLRHLLRSPHILNLAFTAYDAAVERRKPEVQRDSAYMDRNFVQTRKRLQIMAENYDAAADSAILAELLGRAQQWPQIASMPVILGLAGRANADKAARYLGFALGQTRIHDSEYLMELLNMTPEQLEGIADPFLDLAVALYPAHEELEQEIKGRKGVLDDLQARLIDVKRQFLGAEFIPDANGTLRLTYGSIKGYSPADALSCTPLTSLRGLLEKETGQPPFVVPEGVERLYLEREFGPFASSRLSDVPVNMLYDADTVGGSSGSPVFNARGQLVGVNFDRAWEATINDYTWSAAYSRSIGVDIRYVLWITGIFGGARHLLEEMNVKLDAGRS